MGGFGGYIVVVFLGGGECQKKKNDRHQNRTRFITYLPTYLRAYLGPRYTSSAFPSKKKKINLLRNSFENNNALIT